MHEFTFYTYLKFAGLVVYLLSLFQNQAASGKPKKAEASFGGFKKGFLLANPSKSDVKKKSTNDKNNGPRLVEVKQKAGTEKQDPLFLSEVQESLKSQMPLLQSKGESNKQMP